MPAGHSLTSVAPQATYLNNSSRRVSNNHSRGTDDDESTSGTSPTRERRSSSAVTSAMYQSKGTESLFGAMDDEDLSTKGPAIEYHDEKLDNAAPYSKWPLFWFPLNVNAWGIRIGSFGTFVFCGVAVVFRNQTQYKYLVVGICVDMALRALGGAAISPLGAVGELLGSRLKTRIIPGAPIQFHAMMCTLIAALAVAALSLPTPLPLPAAAIEVILALFSIAELFNISAGAKLFIILVRAGFIEDAAVRRSSEEEEEALMACDEETRRVQLGAPVTVVVSDGHVARPTDLKYKKSTDESKRADFHPVKHVQSQHLIAVQGVCAIAALYHRAWVALQSDRGVYQGLSVFAGGSFLTFTILYLCKLRRYPKRITREWRHPLQGNLFSVVPMCLVLLGYVCTRWSEVLAVAFFWIGAPIQVVLTGMTVASWLVSPRHKEFVDATLLVPLSALPTIAWVAPDIIDGGVLRGSLVEIGWIFLGTSVFVWIAIFGISVSRLSLHFHPWDDVHRFVIFGFLGVPAACAAAYPRLNDGEFDGLGRMLLGTSWFMLVVMICLAMRSFFAYSKFSPWTWFVVYPTAMHALATLEYAEFMVKIGAKTEVAMSATHTCMALTSALTALCVIHSCRLLTKRKWFIAEEKMLPLDVNKTVHNAIRSASKRMVYLSEQLRRDNPSGTTRFISHLQLFKLCHNEHTNAEDRTLFPEVSLWFPGTTLPADAEHIRDHLAFDQLYEQATVMRLVAPNDSEFQQVVDRIRAMCAELDGHIHDHLDGEEMNIDPIVRKYIPISYQKKIVRNLFEATDLKTWSVILPFMLAQCPFHRDRVRIFKCWRRVMPDKLQLIGRVIHHKLTPLMWERITSEVPELIPRGLAGWTRMN